MEAVLSGRKHLLPHHTDLSYHNWATQTSKINAMEGFDAVCDMGPGTVTGVMHGAEEQNRWDSTHCSPCMSSRRQQHMHDYEDT